MSGLLSVRRTCVAVWIALIAALAVPDLAEAGFSVHTGPPSVQLQYQGDPLLHDIIVGELQAGFFTGSFIEAQTCFDQIESEWFGTQTILGLTGPFNVTVPGVGIPFSWHASVTISGSLGDTISVVYDGQRTAERGIVFHERETLDRPGPGTFAAHGVLEANWTGTVIEQPTSNVAAARTHGAVPKAHGSQQQAQSCQAPKRFTPKQKAAFRDSRDALLAGSAVEGFIAVVVGSKVPSAAVFPGFLAAGFGLAAILANRDAEDPPDPNFRALVKPAAIRVPQIPVRRGISRRDSLTAGRLLRDYATDASVAGAFTTSIERAQGAVVAHDPANGTWEREQMLAAAGFAARLAAALDQTRRDSPAGTRALKRVLNPPRLSVRSARQIVNRLRRADFPAWFARITKKYGATKEVLAQLRAQILRTPIGKLASLSLDDLSNRRTVQILKAESQAVRAFAKRVKQSPTAPA